MPDEKAVPEGTNEGGSAAPDYSKWFEAAGIDPETDPESIAGALKFHSEWEGKQPLSEEAVVQRAQQQLQSWFSDPNNINAIRDHFRKEWENEKATKPSEDGELDVPRALSAMEQKLAAQIQQVQQAFAQLYQERQKGQENEKLQEWHKQFEANLGDAVKRHAGSLDHTAIAREVRRRFAAGELSDDTAAGLRKAVQGLVKEKQEEQATWAQRHGVTEFLGRKSLQIAPEKKVSEVVKEPKELEQLLSHIINQGFND